MISEFLRKNKGLFVKIDSRLSELPLTPEQHFFASCWHNMVHAYSLDSNQVIFTVDNVSNPLSFPLQIGSITFSTTSPLLGVAPKPNVARYLGTQSKRLFAQVEVERSDYRTAGTEAYLVINNVLDLVRFEYESKRLQLPDEFVIKNSGPTAKYRIFPIPKEFFDRQIHTYAKLLVDLSEGSDRYLLIQLQK